MARVTEPEAKLKKGFLQKTFNAAAGWIHDIPDIKKGVEVQARLHEIMIDGYKRWGRMPQNRDELWAAMKNAGVKPPPEIAQHLSSLPENSGARHFLSCKKGGIIDKAIGTISEIQAVVNSFSKAGKDTFWRQTLPELYSDLIEMYGDRPGRERFGLGINPKQAVSAPKNPVSTFS